MKIRRYVENDVTEAILKMKYELGPDAMILSSKKVKKRSGLFGMFSKQMVEVIAAIDEDKIKKENPKENRINNPKSIQVKQGVNSLVNKQNPIPSNSSFKTYSRQGKLTINEDNGNESPTHKEKALPYGENEKIKSLENEVTSMKSLLKEIYNNISKPDKTTSPDIEGAVGKANQEKEIRTKATNAYKEGNDTKVNIEIREKNGSEEVKGIKEIKDSNEDIYEKYFDMLIDHEVERSLVKEIIKNVKASVGETADRNKIYAVMNSLLKSLLGSPKLISMKGNKPTVVMFVGPTGVGKTTTLAKIAANYLLKNEAKIGFITADTYRIAAVEQLKTYASILDIPVTVIYSPSEINDAINMHQDKDVIFIDTAGRSSKNKAQFDEIKTLVNLCNADEVFLVFSATASKAAGAEIIKGYSFIPEYKLIFTKLDETSSLGIILNTVYTSGKRLSYVTTGQNVPDDIEIANVDSVIENLLN